MIDLTRAAIAGALLTALAAAAGPAHAAVIDTFGFTDSGFSGPISPGSSGTLSGTFVGAVEANGTIQLADLSSIKLTYTVGATSLFGYGPATFFSYLPGSDSTLDFAAPIGVNGTACVGAVAAFGFGSCGAGGVNGEVAGLDITQSLPVVTLISSVITLPPQPLPIPGPTPFPQPQPLPQPGPVTVPEPASLALLAAGLIVLALVRHRPAPTSPPDFSIGQPSSHGILSILRDTAGGHP